MRADDPPQSLAAASIIVPAWSNGAEATPGLIEPAQGAIPTRPG